ncbi:MAG TPA: hypothetical protein VEA99_09945 [Gemmatimonadaceae bacterium]|nr:hypothetical protein [Gemmatimonadaceae bacterium]
MTQTLVVIAILGVAALYLGRKVWTSLAGVKKAKDEPGCGSGCGCG